MKIKMRLHLTFEKELYESSDGKNVPIRREAVLSNKQINTSTKHNMSNSLEEQMKEMARNIEVLEQQYAEGKPIGSGWTIVSIGKLMIDIVETKPLRGSSYIQTPEQFSKPTCGLLNIRKRGRRMLSMVYVIPPIRKTKHPDKTSVLKKITDS